VSIQGKKACIRPSLLPFEREFSSSLSVGPSFLPDGVTVPRVPYYLGSKVGFAVVSIIFISNCIGFVTGSVANIVLNDKLGFGKVRGSLQHRTAPRQSLVGYRPGIGRTNDRF